MKDEKPLEPIETAESPLRDISYSSTDCEVVPVGDTIKRDLKRCQDTLNMFHVLFSAMMTMLGSINFDKLRGTVASIVRFPEGVEPAEVFIDTRSFQVAVFDFVRDCVNRYIADGRGYYHKAIYLADFAPIIVVIDAETPSHVPEIFLTVNSFGA